MFKVRVVKVKYDGTVTYTRLFRMRAVFNTDISKYPYDTQTPEIVISSTDYSEMKVKIITNRWDKLNGDTEPGRLTSDFT